MRSMSCCFVRYSVKMSLHEEAQFRSYVVVFLCVAWMFLSALTSVSANHDVNVNTAGKSVLVDVPKIGEVTADNIIEYRTTNGSIDSLELLCSLYGAKGVGVTTKTCQTIGEHIVFSGGMPSDEDGGEEGSNEQNEVDEESDGKNETISLEVPDNELAVTVKAPSRAYVNQPASFGATPSGISDDIIDSLRYVWNFGDGATGHGKTPAHTFAYPGEYVVIVEASYARHDAMARHEIHVMPVTLELSRISDGGVEIHNSASYEVDISNFTLRGSTRMTFPSHTIVLAGATLTVPYEKVGLGPVVLYDPEGVVVAMDTPQPVSRAVVSAAPASVSTDTDTDTASTTPPNATEPMIFRPESQQAAALAAGSDSFLGGNLPYLGLLGLLSLGILGVCIRRS